MKEVECLTKEELYRLEVLVDKVKNLTIEQKLDYLEQKFPLPPFLENDLQPIDFQEKLVVHSILAIKQEGVVFFDLSALEDLPGKFQRFVEDLYEVELFYGPIGGIIGYHATVLRLLQSQTESSETPLGQFLKPPGKDLALLDDSTKSLIRKGLEALPKMCEIYPVGGAGDRLNLKCEKTQEPLPAAILPFKGKTLLEGLIRDLQGREYLYYKVFGEQVITPIALMTSVEKQNHDHIMEVCLQNDWFGRGSSNFLLFQQPMVPLITTKGDWALKETLVPIYKPGGHGVIWKAAKDAGIFDKLYLKDRSIALVRQINNPIAGVDYGLLAFVGYGFEQQGKFGFASCPRRVNTSEGMDVLIEDKTLKGFAYHITNVEYTDFTKQGIQDEPERQGSSFSIYPANTNILFADLNAIEKALKKIPIPGMMVNAKSVVECLQSSGEFKEINAARLESLMQNIADGFIDYATHPVQDMNDLKLQTFLTYHDRIKTISVTKKLYKKGETFAETPEGAFYDEYLNNDELLGRHCQFTLPPLRDEETYMEAGPHYYFHYHPALGPLYGIVAQKIRYCRLEPDSELYLEIAEVQMENVHIRGSLCVEAVNVVGHKNGYGKLDFSKQTGKCILKNVLVDNEGIDKNASYPYWKGDFERQGMLSILIEGNGEFVAENVRFRGNYQITVPDGYRMEVLEEDERLIFNKQKIDRPSWCWSYQFDEKNNIILRICD